MVSHSPGPVGDSSRHLPPDQGEITPDKKTNPCPPVGHEAMDTGLAYAPVSQAHGHHHSVQCFASLQRCSVLYHSRYHPPPWGINGRF